VYGNLINNSSETQIYCGKLPSLSNGLHLTRKRKEDLGKKTSPSNIDSRKDSPTSGKTLLDKFDTLFLASDIISNLALLLARLPPII
jgi:hypothetical protein